MVPDTHPPRSHHDGPMCGEKWSQHIQISDGDTYPPIYRPSRSVTVDIDGRCRFTYGKLRSIIDRRLKLEMDLWLISSSTAVQVSAIIYTWQWQFFQNAFCCSLIVVTIIFYGTRNEAAKPAACQQAVFNSHLATVQLMRSPSWSMKHSLGLS